MTREKYEKTLESLGIAPKDREFLKKAFDLASKIHEREKRLSGEDFIIHPAEVSLKLAALKMDTATVAAGLLHDAAECFPEALEQIRKNFGEEVRFLVNAVTKVDQIHAIGADRALESVKKMFLALAKDIRVVLIKLMDRLHNMETLEWLPKEKQERIAKETLTLYASLAERLGMWNVKAQLEDLAMKTLWPREYEFVSSELKKRSPERERYLKNIVNIIEAELKKENVRPFEISYRAKHIYSIWQKLERYAGDWSRLSDLIALRLVVPDIKSCYTVLGVIHKLWRPIPGKFKDYIAMPKPNGYRSLHTSVFAGERAIVEFQIRTPELHREAEAGIAAHWAYAEQGKPKAGPKMLGKKFNWITQLQDWQKEFRPAAGGGKPTSEELLEALKIDFFRDRIFILTPRGDVIDLPRGATPLDFAYHIHSEIGNCASGAKVNGRLVSFSWELKSGDTVEIITQKNKKPTHEWLGLVKTAFAKNKIRRALLMSNKKSFLMARAILIEVRIYGRNRVGFIKDISSVFAKRQVNIQNLISARSGSEEAPIKLTFVIGDKERLEKIIKKLQLISGVKKVNYIIK